MRLTAVELAWADNTDPGYTFDLGHLKQVRALQEKTGLGPPVILARLHGDQWKIDDYRETILQGLVGGGMEPIKAAALVKQYVDDRPAAESLLVAQGILMAYIVGLPQGKPPTPETQSETTTAPVVSTSA